MTNFIGSSLILLKVIVTTNSTPQMEIHQEATQAMHALGKTNVVAVHYTIKPITNYVFGVKDGTNEIELVTLK